VDLRGETDHADVGGTASCSSAAIDFTEPLEVVTVSFGRSRSLVEDLSSAASWTVESFFHNLVVKRVSQGSSVSSVEDALREPALRARPRVINRRGLLMPDVF
jgi:hypothetical protein